MANPPVLAVQFVYQLRKMIDIAKDRIKMKRHVPTLITISEDGENDEYLEIPQPPSWMNKRTDEPSPKSLNSVDSGCDSMSDDDVQNQQVPAQDQKSALEQMQEKDKGELGDEVEVDGRKKQGEDAQPDSLHRLILQCPIIPSKASNSVPQSFTKTVHISRIPTTSSSRVTLVTTSQQLNTKSFLAPTNVSKTIYEQENGANALLENAVPSKASTLTSSVSIKREPPNLRHILNNVPPPPLPETTPPNTSSPCRNRLYSGRRKAYAVFPNNDLMLKKSLPRRSKRQQRFGIASSVTLQTTLSISQPSSTSPPLCCVSTTA